MTTSKYISTMVPLNTGQSKHVILKVCDNSICYYCQTNACVTLSDGKCVCVGECADCALSNMFSNSLGYMIPKHTTLDEFVKNENKYVLTPSVWLSAYLDNRLTSNIIHKTYDESKISRCMEILIEMQDGLTSNKLISRVRRQIDSDLEPTYITNEMQSMKLTDVIEPFKKKQRKMFDV
jgi:hypothetical protein